LAGSLRSIKRADVFTKDSIIKVRQPSPSRMAVILAQFGHPHHPKAHSSMLYISLRGTDEEEERNVRKGFARGGNKIGEYL